MTRDSNIPPRGRVEQMEARIAELERQLRSQAQRQQGWTWPREIWLGRTVASSPGSGYPESGNTFTVELFDCHFTASEGTQAVTEQTRGSRVVARTWPAAYVPLDTQVVVKRMRGLGPSGAGEWWIEAPQAAPSKNRAFSGSVTYGYRPLDVGLSPVSAYGWWDTLDLYPTLGEYPTPATANEYVQSGYAIGGPSTFAVVRRGGAYLVWVTVSATLPPLADFAPWYSQTFNNLGPKITQATSVDSGHSHTIEPWLPWVPEFHSQLKLYANSSAVLNVLDDHPITPCPQNALMNNQHVFSAHGLISVEANTSLRLTLGGSHDTVNGASYSLLRQAALNSATLSLLWVG